MIEVEREGRYVGMIKVKEEYGESLDKEEKNKSIEEMIKYKDELIMKKMKEKEEVERLEREEREEMEVIENEKERKVMGILREEKKLRR